MGSKTECTWLFRSFLFSFFFLFFLALIPYLLAFFLSFSVERLFLSVFFRLVRLFNFPISSIFPLCMFEIYNHHLYC